jgi:hypothetical protein
MLFVLDQNRIPSVARFVRIVRSARERRPRAAGRRR